MARESAHSQIDRIPVTELLTLLIREIQNLHVLDDRTPPLHIEVPPPTTHHVALDDSYLTISQVAERLNLSDRQVRYAIEKGLLEAYRFEGEGPGPIRVSTRSVIAYIERCKVKPRRSAPAKTSPPKGKPFKHVKFSAPEGRGSSLDS